MGIPRQTAHRPKKENTDIKAKEFAELRRENQKLRKEVGRLKKEVERYLSISLTNSSGESESPLVKDDRPEPATIPNTLAGGCAGPNVKKVKLGPKTIVACGDCAYRRVE